MSTAYFAPAFRVALNGASLAADLSKCITQLDVTFVLDAPATCSLTLANPHPSLRWTNTKDADLFVEGDSLALELGYADAPPLSRMFDGEICIISPNFPESGSPTVRIEARNRLHWLRGEPKLNRFKDQTDKQTVEAIAREVQLTPEVEETQGQPHAVVENHKSNLEFLLELAKRNNCELLVEGKRLIFRKAGDKKQQRYTLVYGRPHKTIEREQYILPLLRFAPSRDTRDQVTAVIVRGYDSQTKKEIVGRAGPGDERGKHEAQQSGAHVLHEQLHRARELVYVSDTISTQEEADREARALYNQHAWKFLTGSGATLGLPDLRPGQELEILGLGERFSGDYYVTQAKHALTERGYLTTFEVRSGKA